MDHPAIPRQRSPRALLMAAALATVLLASCVPIVTITAEPRQAGATSGQVVDIPPDTRGALQVVLADGREFTVPPGHFPPPGACRIWYPSRPPGQQPPPGSCGDQLAATPPEAVLLRR